VSSIAKEDETHEEWVPLFFKGKKAGDIHLINRIEGL